MLYLNSIENAEASPTERKYAICHDEVPSMLNIPELAPSRGLLARWESKEIDWEEFCEEFTDEMRAEYRNEESRLRKLAEYSLENDVALHSPEPSGDRTYRTILEEIINVIWESAEQTERVINLARDPIEESQLIEGDPQQTSTIAQEEIANLVLQKILPEVTSAKDDEIRLIQENAELRARVDQLEEEINTHTESMKLLKEKISDKDEQLQSLRTKNHEKDRENDKLERQIAKLHEIKTHPKIKDIAIGAAGNDPAFGEYFRALSIDKSLPIELRKWLEEQLKSVVNSPANMGFGNLDLNQLINGHFSEEYDTEDPFKRNNQIANRLLAHVIRTQGNLVLHNEKGIDEGTRMGRALCCFFAAALLAPKLSKADYTTAEPHKSIQPKPNDAEVHYSYGITYLKKGDYNRAVAAYTKAIELKPDYAGAYRNRGRSYYHKGDYASAIKDYTQAIELKPDSAIAYRNRGIAYYRKGDYTNAIVDLTQAIELKPDYADAYNNRGHAYKKKGDRPHAQADFAKAKQFGK